MPAKDVTEIERKSWSTPAEPGERLFRVTSSYSRRAFRGERTANVTATLCYTVAVVFDGNRIVKVGMLRGGSRYA